MAKQKLAQVLFLLPVFILSGCVVRTYQMTRDRVDQDLASGNRGYLQGQPQGQLEEPKERKATRETGVVEVEFRPLIKFERLPKRTESKVQETIAPIEKIGEDQESWGNRGYLTGSSAPVPISPTVAAPGMEKYTVQKNDTLQKISKKFYGTTKKWQKIYEANKNILKGPSKIYPGQVIDVPVEPLKETQENLK